MSLESIEVIKDEFGCPMVIVKAAHLQDFPAFISWLRGRGYGEDTGILKVRLQDPTVKNIRDVCQVLKRHAKKEVPNDNGQMVFQWKPSAQVTYKASTKDPIYQFVDTDCTSAERRSFVKKACNYKTYEDATSSCCAMCRTSLNLNDVRKHLFNELNQKSPFLDSVIEDIKQSGTLIDQVKNVSKVPLYGAGVTLDEGFSVDICKGFSMLSLKTILDDLEDKYDGIAYPYLYAGSPDTFFPWHIEDGGTFSINYVYAGAPKLWFGFAPQYYGLIDHICQSFRLQTKHKCCRALLGHHKCVVVDPEFFWDKYGVPYTTLLQDPGDFILTFPFALHAGFNLGHNLAIAANFADEQWIDVGMYAPVCGCYENVPEFDLTPILRKYRPDLLNHYLLSTAVLFPPGHPREVLHPLKGPMMQDAITHEPADMNRKIAATDSSEAKPSRGKGIKSRTLLCPDCGTSFIENKMSRLKKHIHKHHSDDVESLMRIVESKYPPWKPKTERGLTCGLCGRYLRGTVAHLKIHYKHMHPKEPFQT